MTPESLRTAAVARIFRAHPGVKPVIVLGGASLIFSSYASAVPLPWPWLAISGGIAFVAVAEWELNRLRNLELKESGRARRHRSDRAATSVAAMSPPRSDLDSDL